MRQTSHHVLLHEKDNRLLKMLSDLLGMSKTDVLRCALRWYGVAGPWVGEGRPIPALVGQLVDGQSVGPQAWRRNGHDKAQ